MIECAQYFAGCCQSTHCTYYCRPNRTVHCRVFSFFGYESRVFVIISNSLLQPQNITDRHHSPNRQNKVQIQDMPRITIITISYVCIGYAVRQVRYTEAGVPKMTSLLCWLEISFSTVYFLVQFFETLISF